MTVVYKRKICLTSKEITYLYARLCVILVPFFFFSKSNVCHDCLVLGTNVRAYMCSNETGCAYMNEDGAGGSAWV